MSINLFFKNMRHLKFLNLSCNCLQNANGIEFLYNLEELNLAHNKINNLEVFVIVNQLKYKDFYLNTQFIDFQFNVNLAFRKTKQITVFGFKR